MTANMTVPVFMGEGRITYAQRPIPTLTQPDDVLVRIEACGICGSDVHGMDGSTGRRQPPIIMGHEAAGIITKVGAGVTEWKTGERTEGVTYSVVKLVGKTSGALTSALTMFMLKTVHYDSEAMQATLDARGSIGQTYPQVLQMIFILMTLTMTAAFILQLIPMLFYKYEGKFQKQMLEELRARRLEKDGEVRLAEDAGADGSAI